MGTGYKHRSEFPISFLAAIEYSWIPADPNACYAEGKTDVCENFQLNCVKSKDLRTCLYQLRR